MNFLSDLLCFGWFLLDLSSCESAVLWCYLTSLHDHRVLSWISGKGQTSGTPHWPELAPEVVNNNTMCSTYMRENILDLLARYSHSFGVCGVTKGALILWCLAVCLGEVCSSQMNWLTWSSCCGDLLRVEE